MWQTIANIGSFDPVFVFLQIFTKFQPGKNDFNQ